MMLRGYRRQDLPLLTGPWPAGELLGLPGTDRPALAEPTLVPPPTDDSVELCVVDEVGFVRYSEFDWVHRRARLEVGLLPGAGDDAEVLLKTALNHGFRSLNLHRVHGRVTPAAGPGTLPAQLLTDAGFTLEAEIPGATRFAGRSVPQQLWGALNHG